MTYSIKQAEALTQILCGEFFVALGLPKYGIFSKIFTPLIRKPVHRFSIIASGFDQRAETIGFQSASQWILPNFADTVTVRGNENIPSSGPLLIVANHPGAYDSLVITAQVPRDDIKIIVNLPLDFISELSATLSHFLYAPLDPHLRMNVVRSGIRHLRSGGSILIYASGGMDPDPATMTGAEFEIKNWSRSIEFILEKVPATRLVIAMVSGIISQRYVNHIFTHFRRERVDKQRISEFFQVMRQMLTPGTIKQTPKVSFSLPFSLDELNESDSTLDSIKIKALALLNDHINI